jgi:PPP family 3-phenylpropionic acid transporter
VANPSLARSGPGIPYWRLSTFYGFYFASLGALLPYWSLYLKSLGFSASDIGTLMAMVMGTKIVSPNVWGWIADHTGKRMLIVRSGCLLAVLCFAGVFVSSTYWWLALVMLTFSFFWNATLPQFEATTFNHLGADSHRYSGIRLWGSIGFIIAVAALGPLLEGKNIAYLPGILLFIYAGIWVSSLLVPEQASGHRHIEHEPLRKVLLRPEVLALLAVCFLMQASHGPYYTFYTLYMEARGYSTSLIGQLWALGVIAEVGVFIVMHRMVLWLGLRKLLLWSLVLTVLRWWLTGQFADSLVLMIFAQTLHAASFGIYHAVGIQLIHRYFTGKHQGKGQALYSSLSFGAGGAVGIFFAGLGWDVLGGETVFFAASAVALVALIIAWVWVRPEQPKKTA